MWLGQHQDGGAVLAERAHPLPTLPVDLVSRSPAWQGGCPQWDPP